MTGSTALNWSPSLGLVGTTVDGSASLLVFSLGVAGVCAEDDASEPLVVGAALDAAGVCGVAEALDALSVGATVDVSLADVAGVCGVVAALDAPLLDTAGAVDDESALESLLAPPITSDAPPILVSLSSGRVISVPGTTSCAFSSAALAAAMSSAV